MSVQARQNQGVQSIGFGIITVSDTRTQETDKSGQFLIEAVKAAEHQIESYQLIKDEQSVIKKTIENLMVQPKVEAIIINGGTGIAKRDVTYEAVEALLEKELPGFGELFRYLSFTEDIGTGAMLSRAIAGVVNGKALFSLPGSTGAVRLGLTRLILPEIRHIVHELNK
ncbi:MogA/MoaB family molybdenum cofactor biosynthesis protein [Pullulanibacillus sp. KACC 23026]|uniref:MogA/MoaB family molybdenum cofactor biosynthesis protein n=1 Tax=Pullulanibacillus sp. KACC 23026 TaxID=3028315 RepID=UPI0023B0B472|nr:MogA/MoaB family molybdenum cofactor biosynthesis protein [Pullulanibacillus sp. KACC 23026]WEG13884.1 MogA/MoaB family molybdenum cofactor biosynthesis protein [Pullulanibacillus sp. KACC 23026]